MTEEETVEEPKLSYQTEDVKLTDVTQKMLDQIGEGEIFRMGEDWILRCSKCKRLMTISTTSHGTFESIASSGARILPSIICPHDNCSWHIIATIVSEAKVETKE